MKDILVTGGAGFIGSNLALELQDKYPEATIRVIDDFRATSFKNLLGFGGDVLAYDVADAGWLKVFKEFVDLLDDRVYASFEICLETNR